MDAANHIKEIMSRVEEYNKSIFQVDPFMMSCEEFEECLKKGLDVSNLTAEECSKISLRITQHIYGAQFRLNRVNAIIHYLTDWIRHTTAGDVLQYKGISWYQAEALAINNNSAADKMHQHLREYKLIKDGCEGQIDILKDIAKKIESMRYEKRLQG